MNDNSPVNRPVISIVMPCLDEERYIGRAIESLLEGSGGDLEILVVDGGSTDRTREIVHRFARRGSENTGRIRLLDNSQRQTSAGLNAGIREARGAYIVRADAHCVYPPGYARRCVELLETTGAANAGGIQVPIAEESEGERGGIVQEAIALAMRHPLGAGNARWRLGLRSGFVDTVYLGAFRRDLFDAVGFYDTEAITNQDAELNLRISTAGMKVYLDHTIEVLHYPRRTLHELARQYVLYGRGRAYTALKHRRLTSWRQAAPPLLLAGLTGSASTACWMPGLLLVPAAYAAALATVALAARFPENRGVQAEECGLKTKQPAPGGGGARGGTRIGARIRLLVAAAWAVMHLCWGAGFIWRMIAGKRPARKFKRSGGAL